MKSIERFRMISFIEGLSYLVLLFVAMPMKYIYNEPLYVKITGMSHGILFVIFIFFFIQCWNKLTLKQNILIFILSLLPFGFIWIEKTLKGKLWQD